MTSTEVFFHDEHVDAIVGGDGEHLPGGWYWWACFPGCLPDGDPIGPFTTRAEAEIDAKGDDDDLADLLNGAGWLMLSPEDRAALRKHDDGAIDA